MKKCLSVLLILCILLTLSVPLTGADSTLGTVKITSVSYTNEGDIYTLTVNGSCGKDTKISVVAKNSSGNIKAMEQCKATEGDYFTKTFKIDTSADKLTVAGNEPIIETVYVRTYGNAADSYQAELYTADEKANIVNNKFNKAQTDSEMLGYIKTYYKAFGFDMSFCSDDFSLSVAGFMLKDKNNTPFTVSDISTRFDNANIRSYLFNSDYSADRTKAIEYMPYDLIIEFTKGFNGTDSFYPDYQALNDEQKTEVNKLAFKTENSSDDFAVLKEKFFMAQTSYTISDNKEKYAVIYSFLKAHNDYFELKDLETLSTSRVSQIIGKLTSAAIPSSKDEFVKLYNSFLDGQSSTTGETPSTGGIGGGGGGGGAASGGTLNETTFDPMPSTPTTEPGNTAKTSFGDLSGYEWAANAINYLANIGVVNGKAAGKFVPADAVTREEFAKIAAVAYGLYKDDAECSFGDVEKTRWSYRYIASAYKSGVVTGYADGTFGASAPITREEMAVMIYRVLNSKDLLDTSKGAYADFDDYNNISDYAVNAVLMLAGNGIISGDTEGNFNPKSVSSRAEACQMVYNSLVNIGGNE